MVLYLFFRISSWVVPRLPLRLAYFSARMGAYMAFFLARGSRAGVEANLRRVLGSQTSQKELLRTTLGVFLTAAHNYVDLFRIPRISREELEEAVSIHDAYHFYQEWEKGKGVIIATAHFGNFDLLGQVMAVRDIPVTMLVEPLRPPQLFRLAMGLRDSKGLTILPVGTGAVKAALKALRNGGVVALACDRDIQKNGLEVPFMGEEAQLPTGAIELAMRTKAALIPAFGLRGKRGKYHIFVEPPLDMNGLARDPEGVRHNLKKLALVMEKYIRRYPEQWVVFQPIWKKSHEHGKREGLGPLLSKQE